MKILSKLNNTGMIEETADKRYVTDAEKLKWNNKTDKTYVDNQDALKADKTYVDNKVKTDVPVGAKFTDTVYIHPETHPASMITDLPTGKKVARFVVGTSTAGWTNKDVDYLCDGTADQTEINAAITALPATGGEIVILDGTYNITAPINVAKDNVSIRGNGNATILKRMYDGEGSQGVITLTGRSGCKIANLQIEGNKTTYTRSINYNIYLENSSNNTVTGNTCNNSNWGIYLSDSIDNTVTGNTSNNSIFSGICLEASNDNIVTGNISNNAEIGIYLEGSSNNTVTGNTCNDNDMSGIYLCLSSNNNIVTGNTCNNNGGGIYLDFSSNNTVTGNTCNNNVLGIYLEYSSNNVVTSNTCIRGTGLSTDYTESQSTIQLAGTDNSYNLISNNNCMGKAPVVEGGTGNSVYGNKYDSGDYKDFTQDEKTKLAGIAANANNYTHPTTAGNKHIPAGGASGQILRYSASGTAIWGADNDTITTINGKTGAITKADITALGIPAQDTVVDISGKADKTYVDNKVKTDVPVGAKFTDTIYTHPTSHPASMITESSTKRFVSDAEKANWNNKWDYNESTIKAVKVNSAGNADSADNASKLGNFDAEYYATMPYLQDVHDSLQTSLDNKVNNSRVLTDVPANAKFTDTVYSHPSTHPASMITGLPTSLPADGGNADTVGGFTVGVNVPANAKFTDTVYSHPTTAGNKHIPAGGASGQVLKYSASGTATWQADNDTITTINGKTGAIAKADIVALGIPAQDTVVDISGKADKTYVDDKVEANIITVLKAVYPVGAIYTSVTATNPSSIFGFGTWVSFGAGRTIVGVNTADTAFNTVEKTGGSKTNTLSIANLPAHTHTFTGNATGSAGGHSHTITVNSGGAHTHSISGTAASAGAHTHAPHDDTIVNSTAVIDWYTANAGAGWYHQAIAKARSFPSKSAGAHTHSLSGTAASAGAHTHTASSNSTGAHTHTVSGSNANTGSGTAFNTMDPYITVYMWKRTA